MKATALQRRRMQAIEVRTFTELLTALRLRKDDLGLNMTKLDALCEFQWGYTGKLFSSVGTKAHRAVTDFSLPKLLDALELTLVAVPLRNGGTGVDERLRAIAENMRNGATHNMQDAEITAETCAEAQKKRADALSAIGEIGRRRRWAAMSKKRRSRLMRELAERRWNDGRTEREKKARIARARKAAMARWKRNQGTSGASVSSP